MKKLVGDLYMTLRFRIYRIRFLKFQKIGGRVNKVRNSQNI